MTDEQHFSPICKANGCPLPVSVVTDRYEPEKKGKPGKPRWGLCDFHHAATTAQTGGNWPDVTRRIHDNLRCARLLHAIRNISDDSYKPLAGEKVDAWVVRMDRFLHKQILPELYAKSEMQPDAFSELRKIIGNSHAN